MQKVSKTEQKLIKSLKYKKYRYKYGLFVVEGIKVIKEFLNSDFELVHLYTVEDIFEVKAGKLHVISADALNAISFLMTPQTALAVFKIKDNLALQLKGLTVALDGINDPGNLGTIIRLCDWFDVSTILCSQTTVDCYNPKVIQASMGSISRVNITYLNFKELLIKKKLNVVAADLKGESMNKFPFQENQIIVFGNESLGLSPEIKKIIKNRVTIPRYNSNYDIESINVANSVAIILSELKNRSTGR